MPSNTRWNQHLDSGYSYVILFSITLGSFFQLGVVKVFGVFIPELIEQLQMSAFAVGLCCSIGIGFRALLGPVWGALTHHFTYRQLVISSGVISSVGLIGASFSQSFVHLGCSMVLLSLGSGMPIVAKVLAVKDFFEKKFAMANGIAFTGGAIGMTVLAPIIEVLISTYGWRGAMLIFASMNFNICVAGALLIQHERSHSSAQSDNRRGRNSTDASQVHRNWLNTVLHSVKYFIRNLGFSLLLKHRILLLYLSAMMLHNLVFSGWVLFLVSYTISIEYTAQVASFLSALGGGGALVGRLAFGPLIDKGLISGHTTFFISLSGGAAVMFCYPLVTTYWVLSLISLLAGISMGSSAPIYIVLLKDILRDDPAAFSGSIGLHYMFRSFGIIAGGPLTGWMYDISGNFYISFMTLAGLEVIGALLINIPNLYKKCIRSKTRKSSTHLENQDTYINVETLDKQVKCEL